MNDPKTHSVVNPDDYDHVYGYNGDDQLVTDTFQTLTATWTKTFTYTGSNLTGESAWVGVAK